MYTELIPISPFTLLTLHEFNIDVSHGILTYNWQSCAFLSGFMSESTGTLQIPLRSTDFDKISRFPCLILPFLCEFSDLKINNFILIRGFPMDFINQIYINFRSVIKYGQINWIHKRKNKIIYGFLINCGLNLIHFLPSRICQFQKYFFQLFLRMKSVTT